MSNLQYTVSIKNNSNKVVSSSEEKFIGIRQNSLIKIGNDNNLYTIKEKNNYFLIKNFSVFNAKTIVIEDDVSDIQLEDVLQISYKEYELTSIFDIVDGGTNYNTNEPPAIEGGICDMDIISGTTNPSILDIKETDGNGKILVVGIKNKGKYIEPPQNPVYIISNNGSGAKFDLRYDECSDRTILERTVTNINKKDGKTYLSLNYSLPLNLKQGKFSVEKHYLILSTNYSGEDIINGEYKIFQDYTPSSNIPLMTNNSLSQVVIFNRAMQIIDSEIKSIKDKLSS